LECELPAGTRVKFQKRWDDNTVISHEAPYAKVCGGHTARYGCNERGYRRVGRVRESQDSKCQK
jgi:hypothetical protein